ncbi:MAG: phosphoribosyltransferase family protein [Beijerinckiaceae bacterium]
MTFSTELDVSQATPMVSIPHRVWHNHPKPGMFYPDMAVSMRDGKKFAEIIKGLLDCLPAEPKTFVGLDTGGSALAGGLAILSGCGYSKIRKVSNMRSELMRVLSCNYALGDGIGLSLEAVVPGQKAVLVDDCLVSGSVAAASIDLLRREKAMVDTALFAFEITDAGGRAKLEKMGIAVHSLQKMHSSGRVASGTP